MFKIPKKDKDNKWKEPSNIDLVMLIKKVERLEQEIEKLKNHEHVDDRIVYTYRSK